MVIQNCIHKVNNQRHNTTQGPITIELMLVDCFTVVSLPWMEILLSRYFTSLYSTVIYWCTNCKEVMSKEG